MSSIMRNVVWFRACFSVKLRGIDVGARVDRRGPARAHIQVGPRRRALGILQMRDNHAGAAGLGRCWFDVHAIQSSLAPADQRTSPGSSDSNSSAQSNIRRQVQSSRTPFAARQRRLALKGDSVGAVGCKFHINRGAGRHFPHPGDFIHDFVVFRQPTAKNDDALESQPFYSPASATRRWECSTAGCPPGRTIVRCEPFRSSWKRLENHSMRAVHSFELGNEGRFGRVTAVPRPKMAMPAPAARRRQRRSRSKERYRVPCSESRGRADSRSALRARKSRSQPGQSRYPVASATPPPRRRPWPAPARPPRPIPPAPVVETAAS